MLISEVEAKLKELREDHGDIPVYVHHTLDGIKIDKQMFNGKPYIYIQGDKVKHEINH